MEITVNGKAHAETACLHVWHLVVAHGWAALLLLWVLLLVLVLQVHKLQLLLKLLQVVTFHFLNVLRGRKSMRGHACEVDWVPSPAALAVRRVALIGRLHCLLLNRHAGHGAGESIQLHHQLLPIKWHWGDPGNHSATNNSEDGRLL